VSAVGSGLRTATRRRVASAPAPASTVELTQAVKTWVASGQIPRYSAENTVMFQTIFNIAICCRGRGFARAFGKAVRFNSTT
jgi:hypothetical protein